MQKLSGKVEICIQSVALKLLCYTVEFFFKNCMLGGTETHTSPHSCPINQAYAADTSSFHPTCIVPSGLQTDEAEVVRVAEEGSCDALYTLSDLN